MFGNRLSIKCHMNMGNFVVQNVVCLFVCLHVEGRTGDIVLQTAD